MLKKLPMSWQTTSANSWRYSRDFKRTHSGIHIGDGDAALFTQYVHELIDLFKDTFSAQTRMDRILRHSSMKAPQTTFGLPHSTA